MLEKNYEKIIKAFSFLKDYGYSRASLCEDNQISFEGIDNCVIVRFEEFGLELSCCFKANNREISLQDVIDYQEIKDIKGIYQVSCIEEIEKGINYLSAALKSTLARFDISKAENFDSVENFVKEHQEKQLSFYYYKVDMEKAEHYWNEKQYEKCYLILQKHKDELLPSQKKKLEYLQKKIF